MQRALKEKTERPSNKAMFQILSAKTTIISQIVVSSRKLIEFWTSKEFLVIGAPKKSDGTLAEIQKPFARKVFN